MNKKRRIMLSFVTVGTLGALFLWAVTKHRISESQDPKAFSVTKQELIERARDPQKYTQVNLYVINSDIATPMDVVKIFDTKEDTKELITDDAVVVSCRWKASGLFKLPKAPVEGFVTVVVTNEAAKRLRRDRDFSVEVVAVE